MLNPQKEAPSDILLLSFFHPFAKNILFTYTYLLTSIGTSSLVHTPPPQSIDRIEKRNFQTRSSDKAKI